MCGGPIVVVVVVVVVRWWCTLRLVSLSLVVILQLAPPWQGSTSLGAFVSYPLATEFVYCMLSNVCVCGCGCVCVQVEVQVFKFK